MINEKIKLSDLNNFSKFECEESIGVLPYALLASQDKTTRNEIRFYIHKLEARLNIIAKSPAISHLSSFNHIYYNLGY